MALLHFCTVSTSFFYSTLFPLSLLKRRKRIRKNPLSIIIGESPVLHAVYRGRSSSNLHLFFSSETVLFLLTRWRCSRNFITVRFFLVIPLSDDSESLMLGSSGKHTAYYSTCRAADFFLFPLLYRSLSGFESGFIVLQLFT